MSYIKKSSEKCFAKIVWRYGKWAIPPWDAFGMNFFWNFI